MLNQRIREIRKNENLSAVKFGERLGVKQNTVSQWETGKNTIPEHMIMSIIKEFNVNEDWLRTGKGEMYKLVEDKLSMYVSEITDGNDDFIKDFITVYMELDQVSKEALKKIANKMLERRKNRE